MPTMEPLTFAKIAPSAKVLLVSVLLLLLPSCRPEQYEVGEELRIECQAKSLSQLKRLRWMKNNNTLSDGVGDYVISADEDALVSTLFVAHVRSGHDGFYRCVNKGGKRTLAKLSVQVEDSWAGADLLKPIAETDKLVRVPSGGRALVPCVAGFDEVDLFFDEIPRLLQPFDLEQEIQTRL